MRQRLYDRTFCNVCKLRGNLRSYRSSSTKSCGEQPMSAQHERIRTNQSEHDASEWHVLQVFRRLWLSSQYLRVVPYGHHHEPATLTSLSYRYDRASCERKVQCPRAAGRVHHPRLTVVTNVPSNRGRSAWRNVATR